MTEKELGVKIKLFREKNDLTQKELGDLLKLSHSYISQMEKGNKIIGGRILLKLLKNKVINKKDFFQFLKNKYWV